MAFSNQYGGVPQIHPASSGARMMMEALSSASTGQSKNFFSLAGDLGKIGANFWQDYNDNDARQAMMQYTDSKELQDAIASGKLDLSETSTKFQKEAADQIKNLADTKLAQVNAEKNQFEYDRDKRFEDSMVEATPIINEVQRLMSTGSPADFQKAMELSLQLKDPRILKELGINPREEFRADRKLKLDEQRIGIEAQRAGLEAQKLGLEVKKEELAQAMELAKRYEAAGITPMTGEGAAILKQALGPYFDMAYPMAYAQGGEDAAKDIGVTSSTYSQAGSKELELARQKLESVMTSNPYTKSFDSLNDDAKASLDKSIKGEDMIGLAKTVIEQTLGLSGENLRHEEVAQFAADVQEVYREVKKENSNVTLKDVAAVMLNSNRAFEKNADWIGGSTGNGYYDFKTGFNGLGFKFNPQAFREELLESVKSNQLASEVKDYELELNALESELKSVDILVNQEKSIAGKSGHVDSKRKAQLIAKYTNEIEKIKKAKEKLEAKQGEITGRKLSK
jgi:hypothetical protein